MKTHIKHFFAPTRYYAVVGASNNPAKFGYKILAWYVGHGLPVVPINPRESELLGQEVVPSAAQVVEGAAQKQRLGQHDLAAADGVSFLFLTPPHVTRDTLLAMAAVSGSSTAVKALWFQPGSYDQDVLDTVGLLGWTDRAVHEDECILVRGEEGMHSANL